MAQTGKNEDNLDSGLAYNPIELLTLQSSSFDSSLSVTNSTAFCCTTGANYSGQFSLGVSKLQPIHPNAQFSDIHPQIAAAADVTDRAVGSAPVRTPSVWRS